MLKTGLFRKVYFLKVKLTVNSSFLSSERERQGIMNSEIRYKNDEKLKIFKKSSDENKFKKAS